MTTDQRREGFDRTVGNGTDIGATGSLILDSNNNDAVIVSVENIHAADLDIHLFT